MSELGSIARGAERHRELDRRGLDEMEAARAQRRLDDIAAFRPNRAWSSTPTTGDPLMAALAVVGAAEGIALAPSSNQAQEGTLFDRLEFIANRSGFRFREIQFDHNWWREEGPALIGVQVGGEPCALLWRRGRWHLFDGKAAEGQPVDGDVAATLATRGYMLYPALPATSSSNAVRRFATFGTGPDAIRLMLAAAAAALTSLIVPVATGAIIGHAIPDGRHDLVFDMLMLLLSATLGGSAFQIVRALALVRLGTQVDRRLQAAVWDRVMRLQTSFYRDYSVGNLAQRVLAVDAIRRILAGEAVNGITGGVFALASLGVMLFYDKTLALFALGYALIAALMLFLLGRAQMRLKRAAFEHKGIVSGFLVEILGGIAKLRVAAAELRAFTRWANAFADQRANDSRAGRLGAIQSAALVSFPLLGALGAFALAAGRSQPMNVGDFAAFNSAFGQLTAALIGLGTSINLAIETLPLFARVRPVLEAPLEVGPDREEPGRLQGAITVRNLWFRYKESGPWVLEDVSLDVRPGEHVAVVGASGAGKSTLLRLLLGFEVPARGGIFFDRKDLQRLDLHRVRRQAGTVMEAAGLMPGSIRENIAGSTPVSRERVEEAVRMAGLEPDIADMPMGLESFVMEGGGQLSGGQRQRVLIARALVHRPRIVLFDQATSALDNRTQAIVAQSLATLDATRIVIAHRLSTVREADRIVVLEKGRIVESGRYDDLIERDGPFRRLVERQMP